MVPISRAKTDWALIAAEVSRPVDIRPGVNLIIPASRHPGGVPLCLWALLPTHNHNRRLIDFLNGCPTDTFAGHTVVAGIFAADSFLPYADFVRALARAGISRVTNFPTVAAYGARVGETLTDVGLGFERELQTLCRFRAHGFETATVIREVEHKAAIEGDENFALIELARSDTQVFSKLFGQKKSVTRLMMTPNATHPKSGRPPNIDGFVLAPVRH
ncbi:hypothetical protein MNBD_ALPHA09-648 [hydrothermal vent metagenome]|uniref:TIM-barrel domain-containing protein n=1 Tax=hydrothermal vent metagenome TaxID=652676 RepID=A0A3B0TNH8_9ZZZZ